MGNYLSSDMGMGVAPSKALYYMHAFESVDSLVCQITEDREEEDGMCERKRQTNSTMRW